MFAVKNLLDIASFFILKGEKSKKIAINICEATAQQLRYQETILHFVFLSLIPRLFARTKPFSCSQ